MLGLLTAISVGFNAVVLAQVIAPGPAAPGGPYPYGVGPGGTNIAPGSARPGVSSSRVTPAVKGAREARRTSVKRSKVAHRHKERRTRRRYHAAPR
jgi:hypothetical protein